MERRELGPCAVGRLSVDQGCRACLWHESGLIQSDLPPASDNELGVPSLDLAMQATRIELPIRLWSAAATDPHRPLDAEAMPGIWHFYGARDYRLLESWPGLLARSGAAAVVEPLYAMCQKTPLAKGLGLICDKRQASVNWQRHGLRIFVDLSVPEVFDEHNLVGVPAGWGSYAMVAEGEPAAEVARRARLAQHHASRYKILLLVFGGGADVRRLCQTQGWQNVPLE
jgi:hypothetical protein